MRNNSKLFRKSRPCRKHTPRTRITVGELSCLLLEQAKQSVGDNKCAALLVHYVLNKFI